ncbi:carbonic anhydrase [Ascobolus immersus RN42]|uniref:Carbonic anhydrase n=1 Tax=Ascobolus immersus RN42 TaxID=1160509 RepID=A0A3N4IPB4_ASCIM|nr:carbonic anhydrase [Ascobolus immersus RN42]
MYTNALLAIALAISPLASASCLHGTSLMKREIQSGGKVKVAEFGYTGTLGPLNWANLGTGNAQCATSKVQSPINIDSKIPLAKEIPVIDFPNVEAAEFENLGSTVEVIVNGTTTFGGKEFGLKQYHFHTPSEHRIAEEYFPLEMHMVHEAKDGSGAIVVLAATFDISETCTTDLLTQTVKNIKEIAVPGTVTETGPLNFTQLVEHVKVNGLFQYEGSLTTPPCKEGVTFLITQRPLPINVATYNAMKSVMKFNARYTQNTPGEPNLIEIAAGGLSAPPAESSTVSEAPVATEAPAETPVATEPSTSATPIAEGVDNTLVLKPVVAAGHQ